jgi:fatty-acyl-CoA synthase
MAEAIHSSTHAALPQFVTLAESIAKIGLLFPHNGFTFQDQSGRETTYTFPQIADETARRAGALHGLGLKAGDTLALIAPDPEHFVLTFLAALRIGVIPVPLYPPLYLSRLDAYQAHTLAILKSSRAKMLAIPASLRESFAALGATAGATPQLVDLETLANAEPGFAPADDAISPDDIAFLQYTSGSTAEPRGVVLTHRCLISNARGILTGMGMDAAHDKGVSWLPLYHDMGLIGFVLAPIFAGISVVFIPTVRFIRNPNVWMDTIHAHRATATFAPNFAFDLACRKASNSEDARWDLSSLRLVGCGAEPIRFDTVKRFATLFSKRFGMPENSVMPAYGLAESTLAVTLKPDQQPVRLRRVSRATFEENGRVVTAAADDKDALEHVSCGVAFPGHEIAIMDSSGVHVADFTEGEICLRGPSVAAGYIGNASGWDASMLYEGWLRSGDLGYLADGELYVTGRIKDLIILNGRNIHPQTIEWVAAGVEGVRGGCVAAFSRPGAGGEELVVVAEAKGDPAAIAEAISLVLRQNLLVQAADILCVKSGTLPRTSSGKLRRHLVRKNYLSGKTPQ